MLETLARVLHMDADERGYVFRLDGKTTVRASRLGDILACNAPAAALVVVFSRLPDRPGPVFLFGPRLSTARLRRSAEPAQSRTAVASISTRWSGTSSAATPSSVAGGAGVTPSFAAAREIPSRSVGIWSGVQSTT